MSETSTGGGINADDGVKSEARDPSIENGYDGETETGKAASAAVAASTAQLLAAAGVMSTTQNEPADQSLEHSKRDSSNVIKTEPGEAKASPKSFKTDADDDTPKTFPQILMEILCNDEESDTISWLPHGRSFIIYKKKKFGNQILPKYFKATKFTSFTRKLNRWGFTRVTRGPEMGSYYHKLFLRDDPQLCLRMNSHSSNKFQEPTAIMPNPMSPAGMPFMPYAMMPSMLPPGMTQVDVAQQNQLINQQLQQLQWQQYQLQQYQQQQQAQHHNHANGPPPSGPGAPPGQQPQPQAPILQPPGPIPTWGVPTNSVMMQNIPVAPVGQMPAAQMQQINQQQQQQQQMQPTVQTQNAGDAAGATPGATHATNQLAS